MEGLILFPIITLFLSAKVLKQDFMSPAVINLCWNVFFILGAFILSGDDIKWEYGGVIWILVSCAACLMGQKIGDSIRIPKGRARICRTRNYLYCILIGIIALGLLNPVIYLNAFGYKFKDLFNIPILLKLNAEVAYDRYYGHEFSQTIGSMISAVFTYMGTLIGGYVFIIIKKPIGKLLSLATMVPILILAVITNGKSGVIACAFLWAIGWAVQSLNVKRSGHILDRKLIVRVATIVVLCVGFLYLTMLMRIGGFDRETQKVANNKLQEYAFAQIQAFDVWFTKMEDYNLGLGLNTYMFLGNWTGLTSRKQGVYELISGVTTNIFTQNRGIIMDFGVIGGLVYWAYVGMISGITYKKVKKAFDGSITAAVLLGAIYFKILYGFIISPWIYSSFVLTFIGFGFFLIMLRRFRFGFERLA